MMHPNNLAPDYNTQRLINQLLYLYYFEGKSQSEIAEQFGLSTVKVSRMLKQARDQGLVEIKIRTPLQAVFDMEQRLQKEFGLPEAMVVPQVSQDAEVTMQAVGHAAAQYLLQHLRDDDVICISGGKAISAIVHALEPRRKYKVKIVTATGGAQGRHNIDANYLAAEMADRLGGTAYQLHAPVLVDSPEEHDALISVCQISEVLDMARRANIALVGIGSIEPGSSSYYELPSISEADRRRLMEDFCAQGEILAYIVDSSGDLCAPEYNRRVVGISLDDLRKIPLRIAISATQSKIIPIQSVLRGRYVNTLITDETAAQGVLDHQVA
jgi:DNA-binding transcriptional regulator LsrR (DeoR family)